MLPESEAAANQQPISGQSAAASLSFALDHSGQTVTPGRGPKRLLRGESHKERVSTAKRNLAGNAAATQSRANSATQWRNNHQNHLNCPLPLAHRREPQRCPPDIKLLRGLLPTNYNETASKGDSVATEHCRSPSTTKTKKKTLLSKCFIHP